MNVRAVFEKLRTSLETAAVPYMVTGSFASSAHGIPRATNDIDILIDPTETGLSSLLQQFPDTDYYSSEEQAFEAMRHRTQFNVIDHHSLWKLDFIFRKDRPFNLEEFKRRTVVEIAGVSMYAATPEDLLIAKLEWCRQGESERQIQDVAGIVRTQGDVLDLAYVEFWIETLDLAPQWSKVLQLRKV